MRIVLATDAWHPQVNGVVRTWDNVIRVLCGQGHEIHVIHPGLFRTVPCPGYPAIRLAVCPRHRTLKMLDRLQPDALHVATEGPIGMVARRYAVRREIPFTTTYHTDFPQYLRVYFGVPTGWTYRFMRWFHGKAVTTLVPTESMRRRLAARKLLRVNLWERGVDASLFRPQPHVDLGLPRPIFLNTGRVSWEKGLSDFASLDLPGTKVIVGDGPALRHLRRRFPDVVFTGYLPDAALARHYAAADVFVFPSRTDTFGNVMLEAMSCGTPVAAFPVTGPIDLVRPGVTGILDDNLRQACLAALDLDPAPCREYALTRTWEDAAARILSFLQVRPHALTPR